MDDALTLLLGAMVLFIAAIFIGSFFVWWLWPIAIPSAFPGLVASGVLTKQLTFGQAVALCWLTGALFGKVKYEKK